MEPWFDTHVHLDRYEEPERVELLAEAEAAGVRMLVVGVDVTSSRRLVELAGESRCISGVVAGVHPTRALNSWADLIEVATAPGVVAIGECGFDGAGEGDSGPDWNLQAAAFAAQARIARELGLSLVLHVDGAGAWDHFAANEREVEGLTVVRHYFTGDAIQARWHAQRGHYLSFGNPLRRELRLRDLAATYPAERLLIETDSYPLPGRSTQPADVVRVGEALAELRGWAEAQAREQLASNTRAAFTRVR